MLYKGNSLVFVFVMLFCVCNSNTISDFNPNSVELVANKGQVVDASGNLHPDVLFVGDNSSSKVYLRKAGISFVTYKTNHIGEIGDDQKKNEVAIVGNRMDITFLNCNTHPEIRTYNASEGFSNYYLSHCPNGINGVKGYGKIEYGEVYKYIDIAYYGTETGNFKYDFLVKPGGNTDDISLKYEGVEAIRKQNGKLYIKTNVGEVVEYMPRIYQIINGKIIDIKGEYVVNGNIVKIKIGKYDEKKVLVIDPWITYYGGTGDEYGKGVATDQLGNVLITGMTYSANFPTSPGAFQTAFGGVSDVYVVKFNSQGIRQWATFFGGSNGEMGWGIDTDGNNNSIVVGWTASANFPSSPTAIQPNIQSSSDAYVFKLDPNGARLWATFYGGSSPESADGVCVDINNNILFTGSTSSVDFPISGGAYQQVIAGQNDVFISKLDPNGLQIWSTYYGGTDNEFGRAITTDALGNVGVAGVAYSNFPVTVGAFQMVNAGSSDGFVLRLDASGTPLWSTYIGGSSLEEAKGIVADSKNNLLIVGLTYSANFPATSGSYQSVYAGGGDAMVAKFTSGGSLSWASFYGGTSLNGDQGYSIDIDSGDNIYFSGGTYSTDFAVSTCAFQTSNVGNIASAREDLFVVKMDSLGMMACATYLGGSMHDEQDAGDQIAIHWPYIYVTGHTPGSFPVTTGAYQTIYKGGQFDSFLAQLCGITCGVYQPTLNFSASQNTICSGTSVDFVSSVVSCTNIGMQYYWDFQGATPSNSTLQNPTGITYNSAGNYSVKLIITTPCGKDSLVQSNINVVPAITTSITGNTNICNGSNTILSASNGTSYLWSTGETTSSIVITPSINATYSVVAYSGSCSDATSITVTVNAIPVAQVSNDTTICIGSAAFLSASGGTNYIWSTGASTAFTNVSPLSNSTYTVTAYNGLCTDVAIVQVSVSPLPVVTVTKDTTIKYGTSLFLSASVTGGISYAWYPAQGLSCTVCPNPTAKPAETTTYYVIATDANGCSQLDSVRVMVEIICDEPFVPNAFSPNKDGQNDILYVFMVDVCVESFLISIYNRYGEKVFESNDSKIGWDGFYRDQLMNSGVFAYTLSVKLKNEQAIFKQGNINLLK